MSQLPEQHLAFEQGDTFELVIGPVSVPNPVDGSSSPIDLTHGGIELWLTAKKSLADPDNAAIFQKTAGAGQITVNQPTSSGKNYATCRLLETDTTGPTFTAAFTELPAVLRYDVQLLEPDGRKTTIARGTLTVTAQATRA